MSLATVRALEHIVCSLPYVFTKIDSWFSNRKRFLQIDFGKSCCGYVSIKLPYTGNIRSYPLPLCANEIQSVDSISYTNFLHRTIFKLLPMRTRNSPNPKHIANDVVERSERQSTFYAVSRFNWHVCVCVCVRHIIDNSRS